MMATQLHPIRIHPKLNHTSNQAMQSKIDSWKVLEHTEHRKRDCISGATEIQSLAYSGSFHPRNFYPRRPSSVWDEPEFSNALWGR